MQLFFHRDNHHLTVYHELVRRDLGTQLYFKNNNVKRTLRSGWRKQFYENFFSPKPFRSNLCHKKILSSRLARIQMF